MSYLSDKARAALKSMAILQAQQVAYVNDSAKVIDLERQKIVQAKIVDAELLPERGISKSTEFSIIYFNTNERMSVYASIKDIAFGAFTGVGN